MEKRVLLAVFLSFLVLFVYQSLFAPVPTPPVQPESAENPASPASRGTLGEAGGAPLGGAESAPAPEPVELEVSPVESLVADEVARDVVVETDDVRAVFNTRGAVLASWQLKHYFTAEGGPLELVPRDLPAEHARPFALETDEVTTTERLAQALFKPSVDRMQLEGTARPAMLEFEYRDKAGLSAKKTFRFDPAAKPYVIEFTASVERGDASVDSAVNWGPALGEGHNGGSRYSVRPRAVFYRDGKVSRIGADKLVEEPRYQGSLDFVGVEDHYFLSAEVGERRNVTVEYHPVTLPPPAGAPADAGERHYVAYRLRFANGPTEARFFFGPKDFDLLQAVDRDLVRSIDFGIFSWLVVPLLRALKWINGYVGNYGWSIIILTIFINAAIFPLRHKSVVSMRKMQELQPEIKAIQERYSKLKTTDPARQKMNAEVMNLYRERGVNPASGCVPMLLTMPVLFAFYSLLSVAIEIRGAPFIGWITDLSAHDPLYVTPVLMGISMLVQQRMTPTTADPVQQKMMMFMPVVFTVFFLWVPSGLVIYWLVSNLWAIGQQQVTNQIIGPPEVRPARAPAERRVRKARVD